MVLLCEGCVSHHHKIQKNFTHAHAHTSTHISPSPTKHPPIAEFQSRSSRHRIFPLRVDEDRGSDGGKRSKRAADDDGDDHAHDSDDIDALPVSQVWCVCESVMCEGVCVGVMYMREMILSSSCIHNPLPAPSSSLLAMHIGAAWCSQRMTCTRHPARLRSATVCRDTLGPRCFIVVCMYSYECMYSYVCVCYYVCCKSSLAFSSE